MVPFVAVAQPSNRFTIDDVLSAPYCSNLTPGSDRIAWVTYTEGVRTIQVHTLTGNQTRTVFDARTDDGQDLGDLRFSADGRLLAYVRGGSRNAAGFSPNPTSNPAGAEQAVYVVPADGSRLAVRVAVGSHPVFAPDNKTLLFGQGGQLYVANLDTLAKPTARKLLTARGSLSDYSWSPDGTKVLFTSDRGYHRLIGVYDRNAQTVTWLAPGVDRDDSPVWSPDGRRVAFIRVPGKKHDERHNIQGGNRFAVWTADVATGEGRELWHSPGDDGGFAQYYPAEPLRWTAANQLLFYSEHDNWMHLYRLAADGRDAGRATDLTPGNYEVEETDVSPDGRYVYYSSNNPARDPLDADRRHIWRVDVFGGRTELMTPGGGIETSPVLVGEYVVYRSAGVNRSTGIAYRKPGFTTETYLSSGMPTRFPYSNLSLFRPRQVTFKAADGTVIHGQLFEPPVIRTITNDDSPPNSRKSPARLPKPESAPKRPALIFLHGGPMRQMLLGWHYRGTYYANAYAMNQYLASRGYVVLAVNYRTGIGYGRAFRRADKQGPRGASEYQDVVAAAEYLRGRPDVNPQKIGLWGGSYGGYLTALGLARNSDQFVAGVDLHGVHDWSWRDPNYAPGGEWGIGDDEVKQAFASSPNSALDGWRSPCLFIHGDDDRNVGFAETVDLVQKLRDRNVPTEVLVFPDEVHSFLLHKTWLRAYHAMADFFDKHLKPTAP